MTWRAWSAKPYPPRRRCRAGCVVGESFTLPPCTPMARPSRCPPCTPMARPSRCPPCTPMARPSRCPPCIPTARVRGRLITNTATKVQALSASHRIRVRITRNRMTLPACSEILLSACRECRAPSLVCVVVWWCRCWGRSLYRGLDTTTTRGLLTRRSNLVLWRIRVWQYEGHVS
jgi:hypothetical protein